jgi:hypothetical protein
VVENLKDDFFSVVLAACRTMKVSIVGVGRDLKGFLETRKWDKRPRDFPPHFRNKTLAFDIGRKQCKSSHDIAFI